MLHQVIAKRALFALLEIKEQYHNYYKWTIIDP